MITKTGKQNAQTHHITRTEANFDRASDQAYYLATHLVGLDQDGYMTNINPNQRNHTIHLEFIKYTRQNHNHTYTYKIWITKDQ